MRTIHDDAMRAERYRSMAAQFRVNAKSEIDPKRRQELTELAAEYEPMADKLAPPAEGPA